jgi:ankyrin repeat protein
MYTASISDSTNPSKDETCDRAERPSNHDTRLRNGHARESTCIVPGAGKADETASFHHPSMPPYGFDRTRRTGEIDSRCINNRCLCCCHQQKVRSWGYLHLRAPTSSILRPCNRASCKARSLKTTAAVDLSWMKIGLAIFTSLEVFWGFGGFSIKPSLDIKRVVSPDSRGFRISSKFRTGEYSAVKAVEEFRKAFQSGEASLLDITPDGRSLTEAIMDITSLEAAQESCWDITCLLKSVTSHSAIMECLPALFKFCETAFEFGGFDPFFILNELDIVYDVAEEDVLAFHDIVYDCYDPFGIKWLQNCLKKCPGFAKIPRLIREILLENSKTLVDPETISGQSIKETFLGLSALHWATCSLSWVRTLLEAGHDVSPADRCGRSPLIYAAAYGLLGSVLALLEAGADPSLGYQRQNGCNWSFLRYAMYHGHFHIVFGSIAFFRRDCISRYDIAQTLLDQALSLSCRYLNYSGEWIPYYIYDRLERPATVRKLLELGANPDIFQDDGDNLLHQSWASETVCASLILGAGTKNLDVGGLAGETPAMRAAYEANAPLLQFYLHKGARIQRRDNYGRNIVHYAVRVFQRDLSWLYPDDLWWRYSTLKIVLSYDVDMGVGDHCRCACSVNGCSPSTMLMKQLFSGYRYGFRRSGFVLSIEWLLLVQELVSYTAAEKALAELARFLLFNMSGLTHVCCRPKNCRTSWWQESPIDQEDISEILDEERDLIAALEEDINTLRSPHDQRDPAEAWADILTAFAGEHEDLARSSDPANTSFWDALLHYRDETRELLRAVYPDETMYSVRLEQREALVRRCLDRLNAQRAGKVRLKDRRDWTTTIQWTRVDP